MKWWLVIGAVILSAGAAGAWSYVSTAMPVTVARAEPGEVPQYVEERGKTRLSNVYRITMPDSGRLERITLEPGDAVKKGDVVALLNARDTELMVDQAEAEVDRLQASIEENDDTSLEVITLQQAVSLLHSMQETVAAAAARVTAGKAHYEYAVTNRERVEQLVERQARSQDDLDQARVAETESSVDYEQDKLVHNAMQALQTVTELLPPFVRKTIERKKLSRAVLEAQLRTAEAALAEAKLNAQRSNMISPIDGVVLRRQYTGPRYLAAGTELLQIGRLADMEIVVDVLTQEAAAVQPGQTVELRTTADSPDVSIGKVKRVEPAGFTKISSLGVEQQRVNVIISIDEQYRDRYNGVDYRVWVRIITDRQTSGLRVPRAALFRSPDDQWQLYVVRDGAARLQTVEVGLQNDDYAEIRDGLRDGDLVVLSPPTDLENGSRVEPRPDETMNP